MMVVNEKAQWYVAQIKPNGFDRAVYNLTRQGFQTFMPMKKKTVRHARQLKNVLRPVFPGYLFVQFGAERADWRKINSTFGVARLVSFEQSVPAAVPEELMAGLQARCDAKQCLQPLDDLKIGECVEMVAGAFAGFVGKVESLRSGEGVRVLMNIMGQVARVELSHEQVNRL